jgi:hypothetical protein
MTIFKVPAAALRLLVIACIMLVAVQVTEAARELDHDAGGVLLNRDQVASADTKATLTVFQATAACKLFALARPVASSFLAMTIECFSNDHRCVRSEDCCSGMCNFDPFFPGICQEQCFPNGQRCLRSQDCCSGVCNFDPIFPGKCEEPEDKV